MVDLRFNYKYDYMYFPVDHVTGVVGGRRWVQTMADELADMGCSDKAMKVLYGADGAALLDGDGSGWWASCCAISQQIWKSPTSNHFSGNCAPACMCSPCASRTTPNATL